MVPPRASSPVSSSPESGFECASSRSSVSEEASSLGASAEVYGMASQLLSTLAKVLEPAREDVVRARKLMECYGAAPRLEVEVDQLVAACSAALELDPSSAVALARRSWARNVQRCGELALVDARLALTVMESRRGGRDEGARSSSALAARIHSNMGLAYLQLGKWDAAIDAYSSALDAAGAATPAGDLATKMIARAKQFHAADILARAYEPGAAADDAAARPEAAAAAAAAPTAARDASSATPAASPRKAPLVVDVHSPQRESAREVTPTPSITSSPTAAAAAHRTTPPPGPTLPMDSPDGIDDFRPYSMTFGIADSAASKPPAPKRAASAPPSPTGRGPAEKRACF